MLILVEGMPGSGKSTMAQFLARCLAAQGMHVKWWYEEERGHPALIFHDQPTLQRIVDDLASGDYRRVIAEALAHWRQFATDVAATDVVVILDGCFFGYLTWSLFPLDVPEEEIHAYLAAVECILRSLAPRLVSLYPRDVALAVERICHRRGEWGERFIRNSTDSTYARRRGLTGVAGAVAYWTDYQRFMDSAFADSGLAKLAIAIDEGDWPEYERQALRFLDLPPAEKGTDNDLDLRPFVGRYRSDEN